MSFVPSGVVDHLFKSSINSNSDYTMCFFIYRTYYFLCLPHCSRRIFLLVVCFPGDFDSILPPLQGMARAFHEYPFLPNHSSIRSDAYGQLTQSHLHDPLDIPTRTPSFVVKSEPRIHAAPGHSSRVRLSSQQEKQSLSYPSPPRDDDGVPHRDSYTNINIGINSHFTDSPSVGPENSFALPGAQVIHSDATVRMDRKRKVSSCHL